MAIVQGLKQLKNVVADVKIGQGRIKDLKIGVVDVLKDKRGSLRLRVSNNVQELNNVGSAAHVLKDLDFTLDLLLLDWF